MAAMLHWVTNGCFANKHIEGSRLTTHLPANSQGSANEIFSFVPFVTSGKIKSFVYKSFSTTSYQSDNYRL